MKNKSILLVIAILLVGLSLAGGTYAYLTMSATVTNGNYNTNTTCFNIDYNISNEGSGQDITGTLFPSSGPNGGLSGRVGLKVNASCSTNGIGTLKLRINSTTSSSLMTSAASYCQDRKTLEAISGITTEAACDTAGGRWRGYGDSYCENNITLERLTSYTNSSTCSSNGGTWKSGGSPLKYAVYNNAAATGAPLSKGYITSSDIDGDIVILQDIEVTSMQQYYYIFIWLDGYLTDNTYTELPFSGYISASAVQSQYVYTVNVYDANNALNTVINLNQAIPNTITQYRTSQAAMSAFSDKPYYLRHLIQNGIVTESYVGFVITSEIAQSNPGTTPGTYYLRGNVNESALNSKPIYEANKEVLLRAFGKDNCSVSSSYIECYVEGGLVSGSGYAGAAYSNGTIDVEIASSGCITMITSQQGTSYCAS